MAEGCASNALRALTAFAWTIPELHRIELYIEPWNDGSIRVAAAAGYLREGLLRSHLEIGGTRRDMLLYASIRMTPAGASGYRTARRRHRGGGGPTIGRRLAPSAGRKSL